jgi:hypothetical protein
MTSNQSISRRDFLTGSLGTLAAVTLTTLSARAHIPQTEVHTQQIPATHAPDSIPSEGTVEKWYPDGRAKRFAGNTVLSHLPRESQLADAITLLHEKLLNSPFAKKVALTPVASYHMTILGGCTDLDRVREEWPPYVPFDAPIATCSRQVGERMETVRLRAEMPLRMRLDQRATIAASSACTLHLVPASDAEKNKLQGIREQLADVYGFRAKDFDRYNFHLGLGYQLGRFTTAEHQEYARILEVQLPHIIQSAKWIEFGNPEYCTFEDMLRFETKTLLSCS